MNFDWMYVIAGFTGACVGWMVCSLWTVRWINRERQRMKDDVRAIVGRAYKDQFELERLQQQEQWNRERV